MRGLENNNALEGTDTYIDIATSRKNRPMGRFFENREIFSVEQGLQVFDTGLNDLAISDILSSRLNVYTIFIYFLDKIS